MSKSRGDVVGKLSETVARSLVTLSLLILFAILIQRPTTYCSVQRV